MSTLAARMGKLKSGNINGISRHNDRKNERNSNKEIDPEKSHLNYDLVERENKNITLLKETQDFIDMNKFGNRATRKDSVLMVEWIVTSDSDFFEKLSEDETRHFFETAVEYFQTRFGAENVRFGTVHMDETTPHMHLGIVPFDEQNKLSAKRVFNRTTLLEIQENLPKFLQNKGFDIERGEKNSDRKHLDVKSFKKEMDRKLKAQELMLEEKEKMFEELTSHIAELEIEIDALKIVSEELEEEVHDKISFLEKEELTVKNYGYESIEDLMYENYTLNMQLGAVFDKLKDYAEILSNLKLNFLNFENIKANIKTLIPALENFKEKLTFKLLTFDSFKRNLEERTNKTVSKPRISLADKLDKAKEKLRKERDDDPSIIRKEPRIEDLER